MKRRDFIQTSSMALAGLYLAACGKGAAPVWDEQVGLQIYSLRDTVVNDPKGVMAKVAKFGYKELETFGYADGKIFGMPFSDFSAYVKDLGMKIVSGHYPYEMAISDKWEQALSDAKAIGQEYVVIPWLNQEVRNTIDDYKKVCENLNKAGEKVNQMGMRFGYHNHAFEFETVDGQIPYDVMLAETDPKNVGMELDIYWVYKAGKDPIQLFEKHPGRFEQWHVKDMDKIDSNKNADIGTGTIDWKLLFGKAKESGLQHYYIEQESYPAEPIQSVEAGIKNLKTII